MFLISSHLLLFLSLLAQSRAQTTMFIETTTVDPTTTSETTTETTTTTPETTTETITTTPETTTETTTMDTSTIPETTPETPFTTPETTTETTTIDTSTIPETTPETPFTTPETTTETTTEETTTTTETTTEETTTTTETTTEETTTIASTTPWTAPAIFYPFGSAAGDTGHLEIGSESYEHVAFSSPFTYFTRKYSSIYVNNNGLLTFNQPLPEAHPVPFPSNGNEDYIAALWTELDDIGYGNYWFHEYTNGSVLDRASQDINRYFPNRGFAASWVFVVTWDYMYTTDWNAFNLHSGPAITFQAVLISGGGFSFILMNYGDCAGIYFPVEAGYDTINSTDYYVIHYDSPTGYYIPNLKHTTNVNVPGRWAFLVNNGTENIIGLQMKLRSFLDLTQTQNIEGVMQLIKEELSQGLSSSFGLKIRKVQRTGP